MRLLQAAGLKASVAPNTIPFAARTFFMVVPPADRQTSTLYTPFVRLPCHGSGNLKIGKYAVKTPGSIHWSGALRYPLETKAPESPSPLAPDATLCEELTSIKG